jgi:hypothetical protein
MTDHTTGAGEYPSWICSPCGKRLGRKSTEWSTWHADTCGWCGKGASCTEPRDFGYPPAPTSPNHLRR